MQRVTANQDMHHWVFVYERAKKNFEADPLRVKLFMTLRDGVKYLKMLTELRNID